MAIATYPAIFPLENEALLIKNISKVFVELDTLQSTKDMAQKHNVSFSTIDEYHKRINNISKERI